MNMENKIEIHNMNLHYGDFHALHDINLDIKENEITAFIGPSGCGKSTLLRSLNRMNDLVENCRITGDIMLDGRDIYKNCDVNLLRRRVGMVFQKPNPFPMSIYDNIAYGPRTHGIKSRVQLDEIVDLIVDTVCSARKVIRIAGDDYPAEVVKSRFMKLDSSHVQYVMDCMKDNTTYVRNIKKYLLAALYNAPTTINSYYSSLVQHDMYGDGQRGRG